MTGAQVDTGDRGRCGGISVEPADRRSPSVESHGGCRSLLLEVHEESHARRALQSDATGCRWRRALLAGDLQSMSRALEGGME